MTIERPVIRFTPPRVTLSAAKPKAGRGYDAWFRRTLPKRWQVPEHIRLINEHLAAVERGEIDRLAIHMPPRHGKTQSVTVRFPLRWLERRPTDHVLVTGYNERFARKLSRDVRKLAAVRGLVSHGKSATDEWETPAGGLVMARGVGSPPTGTGFNLIVIDDPVRRREDADSETFRERVWDWYTDDLYTRLEPSGALVLVMTLWHEDDLGARAVASEPGRWTVLKLPAISDDGAALWPERFDVGQLERIRSVMGQNEGLRSWEALYQQNPTPREGSAFKVGKLRHVDADQLPRMLATCRAWDLAATEGAGDFTAGVKVGRGADGLFYVLDVVRGQWDSAQRNARILQTAERDGKGVRIHLPQDPGQAGKEQAAAMVRMLAGYAVKAEPVTGSKETRADPFAAQVNAGAADEPGNVRLVRGAWNATFVEELRAFPAGTHDDQVDGSADAFNEVAPLPDDWTEARAATGFNRRR